MALLDMRTADGSTIGNPTSGNYFIFLDSSNSDFLTRRDSSGTDTLYTSGVIPTELNNLTDVTIISPASGQLLQYNGSEWVNVNKSVYGTELHYYSSAPLTSTTSTVATPVMDETTTPIPIGDYEIIISANVSCDSGTNDGIVEFTFDGAPITPTTGNNEVYRIEFKDNAGNNPPGAGTAQKDTMTLVIPLIVTVAGAKNMTLSIRSESGGTETNMWNAYMKIIRIK